MTVPPEVLVTTMRTNQKYLALRTPDGALARQFVLVANMQASDGGAAIVAGNERVLRARLWDAKFFWDQDRKVSLESRLPSLARMVFHAELGTQGERVERLVALAGALVPLVAGRRPAARRARRAAGQGRSRHRHGRRVPRAAGHHGRPLRRGAGRAARGGRGDPRALFAQGPGRPLPDRAGERGRGAGRQARHLVGFFAAGIRPTGTKDPFALRRAGLGIIRLIFENGLRLPLREAIVAAARGYGDRFAGVRARRADRLPGRSPQGPSARARHPPRPDRGRGRRRRGGRPRPPGGSRRGAAELHRQRGRPQSAHRLPPRRQHRRIEEKKDGRRYDGHPVAGALVDPAEEALFAALETAGGADRRGARGRGLRRRHVRTGGVAAAGGRVLRRP